MRIELTTIASCDGCGACCTEQAALPVGWYLGTVTRMGDPATLPADVRNELQVMLTRFSIYGWPPDGSPCVWYDRQTKRCKHYRYRPEICREEVKVGDDSCRRWRRLKGIDPTRRFVLKGGRRSWRRRGRGGRRG